MKAQTDVSTLWALHKSASIVENPTVSNLLQATRQFLFLNNSFTSWRAPSVELVPLFFQLLRALDKSHRLGQFPSSESVSIDPNLNISSLVYSESSAERLSWTVLLRRICGICLAQLGASSLVSTESSAFGELPLSFLKDITNVSSYISFNKPKETFGHSTPSQTGPKLTFILGRRL